MDYIPNPWGQNDPVLPVENSGQQLQYERELRGLTQEQLATVIGVSDLEVQSWEDDNSVPDFVFRQKLTELFGNDFFLSSEVSRDVAGSKLRIRIIQKQLTGQSFTSIVSALTGIYTQFWLIDQYLLQPIWGTRVYEAIMHAQTQDSRFVEGADLAITDLSYNSPALITLLTDPSTATTAVYSGMALAFALSKVIGVISQAWINLAKAKYQGMEEEQKLRQEHIKFVLDTVRTYVDSWYPDAPPEIRAQMMQNILPDISKLLNGK